jgi:hypothetical protein
MNLVRDEEMENLSAQLALRERQLSDCTKAMITAANMLQPPAPARPQTLHAAEQVLAEVATMLLDVRARKVPETLPSAALGERLRELQRAVAEGVGVIAREAAHHPKTKHGEALMEVYAALIKALGYSKTGYPSLKEKDAPDPIAEMTEKVFPAATMAPVSMGGPHKEVLNEQYQDEDPPVKCGTFAPPEDIVNAVIPKDLDLSTKEGYLRFHHFATRRMTAITRAKNADYTGASSDPFSNFATVEELGICSTEEGFLTRMTDKFKRIISIVKSGKAMVKDESVEDTLLDLANYAILFMGFLRQKAAREKAGM